jgi:hypothetical protein
MGLLDLLFLVAGILVNFWLLGFVFFNLGTIIWVLPVTAVSIIVARLAFRAQNIKLDSQKRNKWR